MEKPTNSLKGLFTSKLSSLEQLAAFPPRQPLLLPMLVLAFGIHAAMLVTPVPSLEKKQPQDKQTPIKVTQIPTSKPVASIAPIAPAAAKVLIPPIGKTTVSASPSSPTTFNTSTPSTSTQTTGSRTTVETASSIAASASSTKAAPKSSSKNTKTAAAQSETSTENSSETAGDNSSTKAGNEAVEPTASVAIASTAASSAATVTFADFPHYQPSEKDCFSLGYGDNCHMVENQSIAQLTEFFQKELTAKQFTVNQVNDEPTHKVFKVSKNSKTQFLNIWQNKQQVIYLLTSEIPKQAPGKAKSEDGQAEK